MARPLPVMIRLSHLQFSYPGQEFTFHLPRLEIHPGEAVALTGPSGCGKSTLLRLCAGLLRPSAGSIELDAFPLTLAAGPALRDFRLRHIGLIFQEFDLLPYLSVEQNILAPLRLIPGQRVDSSARHRLAAMATLTGLAPVLHHLPHQISGGEKQRTGLCRALIHHPSCIFADEPTSHLDADSQERSLDLLLRQTRERKASLLAVSHAREILHRFDRVEHLPDLLSATP